MFKNVRPFVSTRHAPYSMLLITFSERKFIPHWVNFLRQQIANTNGINSKEPLIKLGGTK
jgi:hypothetical protein